VDLIADVTGFTDDEPPPERLHAVVVLQSPNSFHIDVGVPYIVFEQLVATLHRISLEELTSIIFHPTA